MSFKLTTISHRTDFPNYSYQPQVVAAGQAFTETLLPEIEQEGRDLGLGYVILHEGTMANWLLVHWWIEGGITAHLLCRSDIDQPCIFGRFDRPFMACVWEQIAIEHERKAWISTMMKEPPDPEAYLAAELASGLY